MVRVLVSIILMSIIFFAVDRVVVWKHEYEHGPYKFVEVEVLSVARDCVHRVGGGRIAHIDIQILWQGQPLSLRDPFIGFYPLNHCFFKKHYSLYDESRLQSIEGGGSTTFLLSRDGGLYLGRISNLFAFGAIVPLIISLLVIIRLRRR